MVNEAFTIFYTDDDVDDRELFEAAVQDIAGNLQVSTQSNGNELMQVLRNSPPSPHILFLDLNMPGKNGYEVLKEIRASPATKDIPVIIFSTSDNEDAIKTTKQLGASMYIPKPSSFNNLKKIIRHSLSIDWKTFFPSPEQFVFRIN